MAKSTETEIAVLQTQMQEVKASLEVIKAEQHSNFTAIASKIDNLSNTPLEINSIHKRLNALEVAKSKDWVWKTLSAVAGAVLASLIIYAITKGQ
jgi:hypothetical protein